MSHIFLILHLINIYISFLLYFFAELFLAVINIILFHNKIVYL
jgi:hypothetical protein